MHLTFHLLGQNYNPPLNYDELEPEIQRRKKDGDPLAVAYCQVREEHDLALRDSIVESSPLLRKFKEK